MASFSHIHQTLLHNQVWLTFLWFPDCFICCFLGHWEHFVLCKPHHSNSLYPLHTSPSCIFRPWALKAFFTPAFHLLLGFPFFLVSFTSDMYTLIIILSSIVLFTYPNQISTPFSTHSFLSSLVLSIYPNHFSTPFSPQLYILLSLLHLSLTLSFVIRSNFIMPQTFHF